MVKKHENETQKKGDETPPSPFHPSLPLPTIPLIRNFLVKKKYASKRAWIYYIGNCYVNHDVNTSRRTIENISNKSFGLACWLNNKNFCVWK